jgi:hypothetical protein
VLVAHTYNPSYFGQRSEVSWFMKPYLQNTQHKKGLMEWLTWQRACLASVRPWIQTLILPKKKKEAVLLWPGIIRGKAKVEVGTCLAVTRGPSSSVDRKFYRISEGTSSPCNHDESRQKQDHPFNNHVWRQTEIGTLQTSAVARHPPAL